MNLNRSFYKTKSKSLSRPSSLRHEPIIDILRGIAVVWVIAFHSGLPLARGGFLGVDTFFVISGYLITKIVGDGILATGFGGLPLPWCRSSS